MAPCLVRLVLALGVAGVLAEDVLDVPDYGEFVSVWPEPQTLTTTPNGTTARLSKALRVTWRGACAAAPLDDDDDAGCGVVARAWARLNASLWALAPGTPPLSAGGAAHLPRDGERPIPLLAPGLLLRGRLRAPFTVVLAGNLFIVAFITVVSAPCGHACGFFEKVNFVAVNGQL